MPPDGPDLQLLLLIAVAAFMASTVASVAGFGGSAILLPVLVPAFGPRDAVLILTIVQLGGNLSRVAANGSEVALPVVGWFALGAVPFAVLGGAAFASAPLGVLTRLLGVFLIAMVVWRHTGRPVRGEMPLRAFAVLGAVSSFVSALIGTTGPLLVPFFLAHGLLKGAFIGTEALATVVIQVGKVATYAAAGVFTVTAVTAGVAIIPVVVLGSFVGKRVLRGLSDETFVRIVEGTMIVAGAFFIAGG